MAKLSRPRFGSLQFYPRKRAAKFLPSVNWKFVQSSKNVNIKGKEDKNVILGFIGYKVGMASAVVKDNTPDSLTKGKRVIVPVTILEMPNMKVFSVRFYKHNKVVGEVVVSDDKELKRRLSTPKQAKSLDSGIPGDYEDVRIVVYSVVKSTNIKKTPDVIELAVRGNDKTKKLEYVKSLVGKEISVFDFANEYKLLDLRALTKGKGLEGPVARFGIGLKSHKSEKGRRRPGSLGPWHPARVTFRTPMAGQLGMFTRITYNTLTLSHGNIAEKNINPKSGFNNYGEIKTNYLIVKGSVHGPSKRQVLLTPAFRPTRKQGKKNYEFVEVLR